MLYLIFLLLYFFFFFFFFNDTATTEIYTLSLHDALPISTENSLDLAQISGSGPNGRIIQRDVMAFLERPAAARPSTPEPADRKSTRLNSSHTVISYAVFCLKKKKNKKRQ